jgi:hypothetical protein
MLNEITKFILKIIFFQNIGGPMLGRELAYPNQNPPNKLRGWGYPPLIAVRRITG